MNLKSWMADLEEIKFGTEEEGFSILRRVSPKWWLLVFGGENVCPSCGSYHCEEECWEKPSLLLDNEIEEIIITMSISVDTFFKLRGGDSLELTEFNKRCEHLEEVNKRFLERLASV
jgi:hypothetical protein